MRLISRILLLLTGIIIFLLIFITRCGLNFYVQSQSNRLTLRNQPHATETSPNCVAGHLEEILRQKEGNHQQELQKLHNEISNLKLKLLEVTRAQSHSNIRLAQKIEETSNGMVAAKSIKNISASNQGCYDYIKRQINSAEIKHGVSLNNEHEVIQFSHFTFNRIYPVDLRLGKRVVEKPIGFRRKDLVEVFVRTLDLLNKKRKGRKRYTADDIVEGIYRTEPTTGTQYEIYVQDRNVSRTFTKIVLLRPFAPIQTIMETTIQSKDLINIIVPLSGRLETFRGFIDRFIKVGIKLDKNVCLSIVYFGTEGLGEVQNTLTAISREYNFHGIKLITMNETFSRGKGLQVGAQAWPLGDVLLFMCDVDIAFSTKFLDRCRLNTSPGRSVYYPIVFSLYNPNVVYSLHDKAVPSENDQLVISRESGFWRDFGYGMTCQYLSDFRKLKGFDEDIVGWGGEDVLLYRKYVQSSLTVIRATDPGIFHIWHEKKCDPKLSASQYRACIHTRVINEASHEQLGLLAYKDDILQHKLLWMGSTPIPPK